jgi:tryptophan synthase alpha chain
MSRIQSTFSALRADNRTALIPFVTAGDPRTEVTVPLMHAMVAAGADIIELGVPFSDPMAEGPVIQAACERALEHHMKVDEVFGLVKEFRQQNSQTPVILMGYLNPIEVRGYEEFGRQAAEAGVDGILTVDLPPEEADSFCETMNAAGLDTIFLVAPTSTDGRIQAISSKSSGFVYYVSLKGVTGASHLDVDSAQQMVDRIRQHTDLPVGVGFGIKDAESAKSIAAFADAVVVGSAIVRLVGEFQDDFDKMKSSIGELLESIRNAVDSEVKTPSKQMV